MTKYFTPSVQNDLTPIFRALADPTRRNILERLTTSKLTVTQIASGYSFALPTISKHLTVLEKANLVERKKIGRQHTIQLQPATVRKIADYVSFYKQFWHNKLDNLAEFLHSERK